MKKKAASGTMLTLLLTTLLTLTLNVELVKTEPTTIIVPDDYPTIQEAIDNAWSGDTVYVRAGTYYEHVSVSKALTLIGEDRSTTIIDGGGDGTVVNVPASNVIMSKFTIQNSGREGAWLCGIILGGSSNLIYGNSITNNDFAIYSPGSCNVIYGNSITNNRQVMFAQYSSNNCICENNIANNDWGLELDQCLDYKISGNKMTNTRGGFYVIGCSNFNISGNDIANCDPGMRIGESEYTLVFGNDITGCPRGIDLSVVPHHNLIFGNNITDCTYGVYLELYPLHFQLNNTFYHNNFVGNTEQVRIVADTLDTLWNSSYPTGGNHWSDYTGEDFKSGPSQDQPGSDGIGDTPYVIDSNNQDNYPLMNPWIPPAIYDLSIVEINPIQVIWDAEALVLNKPSVVSVDVASTFPTRVWAEINVTYDSGTKWYLETGPYGNGTPIYPGMNRIYIPGGPIHQKTCQNWILREKNWTPPQGDSFFLRWTTAGTDNNIKAKITPLPSETNPDNNEMTVSKQVVESKTLKILVVPVYFPDIGQNPFTSSLDANMEFLNATYPVEDSKLQYEPSRPRPISGTPGEIILPPYTIPIGWWLYLKVALPISIEARLLGYDRAVIIIKDVVTRGSAPGLLWGDRVPVFVPAWAFSMNYYDYVAHEIGHTYYLWHPHDIGPAVYEAQKYWVSKREYEELSRTFMSYWNEPPEWFDPSDWRRLPTWIDKGRYDSNPNEWRSIFFQSWNLFDQLTEEVAGPSHTSQSTDDAVLVRGSVFKNGTVSVDEAWYRLTSEIFDLLPGGTGNYSIVSLNSEEQVLNEIQFNATFCYLVEEDGTMTVEETDLMPFSFRIPYALGTATIEIRNATGHTLTSKAVSSNPPTINIAFPNGGEILEAGLNYTIAWDASDLDGDALTYTLAYSEDGGKNWIPLATDLKQTSYICDTRYLQKGSNYLIKVIATDGVNTGEDVSDGTFTVLVHDVAVINVTTSTTDASLGETIFINVTVENQGGFTENFDVVLYANTTIIDEFSDITLTSGESTTVTFIWETTGFVGGNYVISASATYVLGETDTADNTYIDGEVTVLVLDRSGYGGGNTPAFDPV